MGNGIQLENGYTKIANELLEVIYGTNFNSTQLRIILCVIRYTYGFNRKSHSISLTFLSNSIGISKRYISEELGKLINAKVIIVAKKHSEISSRVLMINKNYSEWLGYRTILIQGIEEYNYTPIEEGFNTTDEEQFNTTDEEYFNQEINNKNKLNKKDIPLKKESKIFTVEDKEYLLAEYLSKQIAKRLDKPLKEEKILQNWAYEFDKMVRLDKYDIEEMKEVLIFSQKNDFWQSNILSAGKFRKQYLTLLAQMKAKEEKERGNKNGYNNTNDDRGQSKKSIYNYDKFFNQ